MQKRRVGQIPLSPFPFEVIRPNGNVLSVVFGGNDSDRPWADFRIPYQMRQGDRNIRRELETKLEEFRWLLIVGRTGIGKTREAAELIQIYNREGWTVLWLKPNAWIAESTSQQLEQIGSHRKLLFFLDDLNSIMFSSPQADTSFDFAALTIPTPQRLAHILQCYEKFCGPEKIRVIATACNEKTSSTAGEASEWEKLEWDKYYKQWWERFEVYELPEPDKTAIVQLLSDTALQTCKEGKQKDYLAIAEKNDGTFTNVVENLRRLYNQGLPLSCSNYSETCQQTFLKRYQDAIKRYPSSRYIYDAIDLLQQLHLPVEIFILEPTAQLLGEENFRHHGKGRQKILRALRYLLKTENILHPRRKQIAAKKTKVEVDKYILPLWDLVLKLKDAHPQKTIDSLFYLGCQLLNLNRPQQALACFHAATTLTPEMFDGWFYQGAALQKLGLQEAAITFYDKALAIQSKYYQAWYNRGLALYLLGRYEQAVTSQQEALAIEPNLQQAWYHHGLALAKLQRHQEAIASYDKAVAIQPEYYQAWYSRGVALEELKRYQEAVASYDKALAIKPELEKAWNNRGDILYRLGLYEEAVASYDKALALAPESYQVWYSRSIVLTNLGRYQEALASCNQTLALKSDYYQAWNLRGNILYLLRRYEEAVACYDKALLLKPDFYQGWNNRASALYLLGLYKETVVSCQRALAIKPDLEQAWYHQGNAQYLLGQYEQAVAAYDKLLAIKQDLEPATWYKRGNALYFLGRYEEALAAYDKVLLVQPHLEQAWNNRGIVLVLLGRYEEAISSFRKAIELAPNCFDAVYNQAYCYALQENTQLALENLQRAIALNSECVQMVKNNPLFAKILKDEQLQTLSSKDELQLEIHKIIK